MKTIKKRPLFTGNEGVRFDTNYQPSPEAKSAGWQERRKQKLLTQGIVQKLIGLNGDLRNLEEYIQALIDNAKAGNAKAMEVVNKAIENDQVINEPTVITVQYKNQKELDLSVLSKECLTELLDAYTKQGLNQPIIDGYFGE